MLTDRQMMILENEIYEIAKRYLTEKKGREFKSGAKTKNKNRYKDLGLKSGTKRNTIRKEIDDPTVNKAAIAYELYNSGEGDKDGDRSLFYKKLHQRDNDNGSNYDFTDAEINKIASILGEE
jgi:hypothetical protein